MSKSSKGSKTNDNVTQFCSITGASQKDAAKFLAKHGNRLDAAMDAYYNDPSAIASTLASRNNTGGSSAQRLSALFDKYKDPGGQDVITVDGTIKLCEDLGVNPEDVVLLAVAYELKSPTVGEWKKKGWMEGWSALGCDTIPSMQAALPRLSAKLGKDPKYFQTVYNFTFDFAKSEGQRSIPIDTAQAFWSLLLPHGLKGGALSHIDPPSQGDSGPMATNDPGWKLEYNDLWFEFLNEKGGKGVSKDTWTLFFEFVRTIDSKFETYDQEGSWPSTIDDFVEWAKAKLRS